MGRLPLAGLALAVLSGCAPAVWRDERYVAEVFKPLTEADVERERAIASDPSHPMAPAAAKLIAGLGPDGAGTERGVVLRCAQSSIALDFSTALLAPGLRAKPGDVLRVEVDAGGRAVATANLTGAALPEGLIHWHGGLSRPPPDRARYVHWRGYRWIVRCHQPDQLTPTVTPETRR